MKNRFVKNLFQTFSLLLFSFFLVFILAYEFVFVYNYENMIIAILLIISILTTSVFCLIVGSQVVVIDENGIALYLLCKKTRQILWCEIETIKISNVLKSVCYTLCFKDGKPGFNLDFRKSIKNAILYYAPKEITEEIELVK